MKKFIRNKLKSLLNFIETHLKLASKSPVDIYLESLSMDCFKLFEKDMKKSLVFSKDDEIRKYSLYHATKNNPSDKLFLEFGVYKGDSINTFAKYLSNKKSHIFGFDSFEGLEEEWITHEYNPVGTFSLNKKPPKVDKNVTLVIGKVQDTLENFLKQKEGKKIVFVHMDMDTFIPTQYVLKKIKPLLNKGAVILFDEFYGFPNWKEHEYKALTEIFNEKEYKYIAFGTRQAAIEIL